MAAFCTSDPGEPVTQNPAVQVALNDGPKIGTIKPIGPFQPLFIDPFKVLEMIFHTLVIGGILRSAGTINCGLCQPGSLRLAPWLSCHGARHNQTLVSLSRSNNKKLETVRPGNIGRKVNLGFAFGTLKLADQAHLVLLDKKGKYGHQDDKKTTDEIQGQE